MSVNIGDPIGPWTMESVDPAAMRTTAAICRDPNPIHWDHDVARAQGFGDRVVNQGPLNLGYVVNMLLEWAGPDSIRRIGSKFTAVVQEGDRVVARGTVTGLEEGPDRTPLARCECWLEHDDGTRAVTATALVDISALAPVT